VPAPAASAASAARIAIVVGPAGSQTAHFRALAGSIATSARRLTPDVTVIASPRATWSAVRDAARGATVLVYLGRGRGFPSPYSRLLNATYEDGFGLNPVSGRGDSAVGFYGERYMRTLALAPNALVLLLDVPYAAGAGEKGAPQPSLATARQRADNYAAGFLAAGAAAVIADAPASASYYLRSVLTTTASLDAVWRAAPTRNGHLTAYRSGRTPGATARLDPEAPRAGYDRAIVGRLGMSTAAVRSGDAGGSPPALYGSAIGADSLNNSVVGGPDGRMVSYRFRATESAELTSIRVYVVTGSGYSGGSNGSLSVTVQTDDGSAGHRPSGTVLATAGYTPGSVIANDGLPVIAFPSPAQLTAGRLYHVVFRNADAQPTRNYVSLDGLFTFGSPSPWQPRFANTDWANLTYERGAWSDDRGPGAGVITPIMALTYGNGAVAGVGYMEVWVGLPKTISGPARVREVFTVSGGDRPVRSAAVRVRRLTGTAPLTLRLETAAGTTLGVATVSAGLVPDGSRPGWVTAGLDRPVTLEGGSPYSLVLEAPAGTSYSAFAIREGAKWGFPATTYFADGIGQYTTGSGWLGFDQPGGATNLPMGDLQFYLQ